MAVQLITKAAYARHRGCDEKAVRKAIAEERISAIGGKIDPVVADIQWERNTRARVKTMQPSQADMVETGADLGPPPAAATGSVGEHSAAATADPSYMQFRARREQADAQIAEMNAAKMRGSMLMRDDVDRAMFEIGRELRDRLTACARRVASEVASISSAEGCEMVIDREHRIVLEQLVSTFREKVGAPVREAV